jgi:hypothetical protein
MLTNNRISLKRGVLVLSAFGFAWSPAQADFKSRTGAECAPASPSAFYVGRGGQASNNSTTASLEITCGVGRDSVFGSTLNLTVYLFKATGAGAMSCHLVLRDLGGSASRTVSKNVTGSGFVSVSFSEAYGFDTANFTCVVPKVVGTTPSTSTRSGIIGYTVDLF